VSESIYSVEKTDPRRAGACRAFHWYCSFAEVGHETISSLTGQQWPHV